MGYCKDLFNPYVFCDRCRRRVSVNDPTGKRLTWFMDEKAPPGWNVSQDENGVRTDVCVICQNQSKST